MSHDIALPSTLTTDDITDVVFRNGRTVNSFTDQEVTDKQIQAVWDVVRWGPTAMNSLPLRLLLVRSHEARERQVAHMSTGNKEKTRRAPLSMVVAADVDFHEKFGTLAPHLPKARDNFAPNQPLRQTMSRDNAFLQTGYLILALRADGLQVGPMTGFDATGMDQEFFAGTSWRSLVVLNVGHAPQDIDGLGIPAVFPRQNRLDFEEIARAV